jgi:hypothetical protein
MDEKSKHGPEITCEILRNCLRQWNRCGAPLTVSVCEARGGITWLL